MKNGFFDVETVFLLLKVSLLSGNAIKLIKYAYFKDLSKNRVRNYALRQNPDNCTTRISAQNFLAASMCTYPGFTVSSICISAGHLNSSLERERVNRK